MSLSYQTAGESHGPALISIISGMPAGVPVDVEFINTELRRRQGGYGRGGRQKIETDVVEVLSGVRLGKTIGSPVALRIANKDSRLDDVAKTPPVHTPRPGHADLAGSVKYLTTDCRETLERASARETAARVAAGALARCLLREVGIEAFGFVRSIHGAGTNIAVTEANWRGLLGARDASDTYCPDPRGDDEAGGSDPCGQGRQGHRGRCGRVPRLRLPAGAGEHHGLARPSRRAAGRRGDGRAGDQGRGDRTGHARRRSARLGGARPDQL